MGIRDLSGPPQRLELLGTIHVRGCIHAVGLWLKDNFQATLAIVCSLLLPQVRAGGPGILEFPAGNTPQDQG